MNKKIKKSYGDKIYIEWSDAYTEDGWKSFSDMKEISNNTYCFTNAWFVAETKDFIIVCHTIGKTQKEEMMGKLVIPKKWIKMVK